jgi:hypothetical protein
MEEVGIINDHWSILWLRSTFFGLSVYFIIIWYIFPVLVCCTEKNLATLPKIQMQSAPERKIAA